MPKGAKVVAKCGSGCGSQTVKAKRFGRVVTDQARRQERARAGKKVEIRVTLGKTGTGDLQVRRDRQLLRLADQGRRDRRRASTRCLNVKTSKIETCK